MVDVPLRRLAEIPKQYAEIPYQKHPAPLLQAAIQDITKSTILQILSILLQTTPSLYPSWLWINNM